MWREARGEGSEGMTAVGCVIHNRVLAGRSNWLGVIYAPWQFSSMTAKGDPELSLWPKEGDSSWDNAMLLSEHIYTSGITDPTGGATHYFATSIEEPSWAKTMTFTVQIGHQRFYK